MQITYEVAHGVETETALPDAAGGEVLPVWHLVRRAVLHCTSRAVSTLRSG